MGAPVTRESCVPCHVYFMDAYVYIVNVHKFELIGYFYLFMLLCYIVDYVCIGETYSKVKSTVSSVIRLEKCRVMISQFRTGNPIMTKNIFCLWRLDDYNDFVLMEQEKSGLQKVIKKLADIETEMNNIKKME